MIAAVMDNLDAVLINDLNQNHVMIISTIAPGYPDVVSYIMHRNNRRSLLYIHIHYTCIYLLLHAMHAHAGMIDDTLGTPNESKINDKFLTAFDN